MRTAVISILVAVTLFSCLRKEKNATLGAADVRFDAYKGRFIESMLALRPEMAIGLGRHEYDTAWSIPDDGYRTKLHAWYKAMLDSLHTYDPNALNPGNRTDWQILTAECQSGLWYLDTLRTFEWNPAQYNIADEVAGILTGTYAPLDIRLHRLGVRLQGVAAYYAAARSNIIKPTFEHTLLAIAQNKGTADLIRNDLIDSLKHSSLSPEEKEQIFKRAESAVTSIDDYVTYLEKELLPTLKGDQVRSFRLGESLYEQKFHHDIQAGLTAKQLYEKALLRKAYLHQEMFRISTDLWPTYFPGTTPPADTLSRISAMIGKLSLKHVRPDSFLVAIQQQIPQLETFIREKDLLYLDPDKPLLVRRTPAYMEGVAGASISAPGPFDKQGNTYYNVSTLENYSPEDAENYLQEYNNYILQILNIHEAIPGHYTQIVYANQSPSLVKSIFGNGAMIEGWAVYTERMMLEEGYGGNSPEMWLMYYKWNLRVTCNTILDYGVHVQGMTEADAMDLLVKQAFQKETEARGKWKRVTLSQVQLTSYFSGFTEIYDLREALKLKKGSEFRLRQFHEEFLSYGSAPVKVIRELMLNK